MAVGRWAPVAAGAAVLVVGGGAALLARSGPGPAAAGRPGAPAATSTAAPAPRTLEQLRVRPGDTVTASGTVVAAPGKPVRFCAPVADDLVGTTGPERPPECWLAVTLLGADPGRLTEPKTFGGTRWGQAAITGRWSRGTITVTAQGAPVPDPGPDSTLPDRPPCPAPVGGWREGVLDQSGTDTLTAMIAHNPTAYGELVLTYPDGPPSGPTDAPENYDRTQVALVTTTLDPAVAEKALRARFDGNLCVRPAVRSRAATDAVWQRIKAGVPWKRYGAFMGAADYLTGRVTVSLVVLDDAAYRWLHAAGGAIIDARPWLRPPG